MNEQTGPCPYAAQVPPPVSREVFLSCTPDEVVDQPAQWRDRGAGMGWLQTSLTTAKPAQRALGGVRTPKPLSPAAVDNGDALVSRCRPDFNSVRPPVGWCGCR
jgi:hypothetical protein